jgi:hypothetical protein
VIVEIQVSRTELEFRFPDKRPPIIIKDVAEFRTDVMLKWQAHPEASKNDIAFRDLMRETVGDQLVTIQDAYRIWKEVNKAYDENILEKKESGIQPS